MKMIILSFLSGENDTMMVIFTIIVILMNHGLHFDSQKNIKEIVFLVFAFNNYCE